MSSSSSAELDERVLAKAALDAAEEQLQSLCASHAGTFVSVERRARAMQEGLQDLLETASQVETKLQRAQEALEHEENSSDVSGKNNNKQNTSTIAILSEKHRVRRRTLLQHSSLLELLELPSLMDACVRSNLYEEALSIAAFANTLERRHYNNNNKNTSDGTGDGGGNVNQQVIVVARVIEQIRSRQTDLRRHLLHRLKQTVTMPECLEVVTALRRLNSIDLEHRQQSAGSTNTGGGGGVDLDRAHAANELRLQVDFLEARDIWLETSSASPTTSATTTARDSIKGASIGATANTAAVVEEDLLDTIERYRTRVFEVATQFNAIFRAQQSSSTATDKSSSSSTDTDSVALLLSMWTSRRVHAFLTLLQSAQASPTAVAASSSLPVASSHSASSQGNAAANATSSSGAMLLPDASSLRDALEASVFFASSMGRLGADFTAQLPAIFEPRMHDIVVAYWKDGAKSLQETLKVCREAGVATPLLQTNKMESSTSSTAATAGASNASLLKMNWTFSAETVGVEGPQASAPRQVLMAMPPLARLVNAVLQGLNELRRCLLPGIFSRLRTSLHAILQDEVLSTILTQNQRAVMVPGLRGDAAGLRNAATLYKQAMSDVVIPYCLGSLEAALGNHDGALEYYTTVQENMKVPEPVPEEKEEEQEEEKEELVEEGAGDGDAGDTMDSAADAATGGDAQEVEAQKGDAQEVETQEGEHDVQTGPTVSKDD